MADIKIQTLKPEKPSTTVYHKRPGTTSFGFEYEYLMGAFVALKLINNPHVENFEITNNDIAHGVFDDLAVKIRFSNNTEHTFLFQLTHHSSKRKISLNELTTDRGVLSLLKYFYSFRTEIKNTENVSCILYTNRKLDIADTSFLVPKLDSTIIEIRKRKDSDDVALFNTGSIFRFSTTSKQENLNAFFKQFYLCTDQIDVKQLHAFINETLANMLQCQIMDSFINFIREWWLTSFILTKQDVATKLAELVFSPFIIKTTSNKMCNQRTKIFQEAIMQFEITLVQDCDDGILENIWEYPEWNRDAYVVGSKFGLSSQSSSMADEQRVKIFWYLDEIPLIVRVDDLSNARIKCAIKLLEDSGSMKKLILVGDVKRHHFDKWEIFENLSDLLCLREDLEAFSEFRVSLQERQSISIQKFAESGIAWIFNTKELLKMTQEVLHVGAKVANLPEPYIPRYITAPFLKEPVREESAHDVFTDAVNILYSEPGGGKTTLMASLANHCPSDHWAMYIKLGNYTNIFKRKTSYEALLANLCVMKDLSSSASSTLKFRSAFLKTNKIYIFMDALDELDTECLKFVLDFVTYISGRGIHVWLSSREYLKEVISSKLNAKALYIQELSKDQEDDYFQKRTKIAEQLPSKYTNNTPLEVFMLSEISLGGENFAQEALVLTKIYKKFFDVKKKDVSDCFLRDYEIPALKTCLNSKTFAKLDLNENYSAKFLQQLQREGDKLNIISRVDYDQVIFTNQSYAEYFACVWLHNNLHKIKLLTDDIFLQNNQNLRLMFDTMMAEKSVLHLAVIYQIDEVKNFINNSDARDAGGRSALHLLCSYHRENEDAINILLDNHDILEQDKLLGWNCIDYAVKTQNFFVLDKILARNEDSQFFDDLFERHDLALLASQLGYSNLLESSIRRDSKVIDSRFGPEKSSLLHIAVRAKSKNVKSIVEVLKNNNLDMNVKDGSNKTALQLVVEACDYELAKVLIEQGANVNCVTNQKRNMLQHAVVTCRSTPLIIKLLIDKINDLNATDIDGCTCLHLACKEGNYDIVKELLDRGLNINAVTCYKKNALHYATCAKSANLDVVKLLITRGIDVNATAYDGTTPLHLASAQGHLNLVETLLENGADLQYITKVGRTVLHYAALSLNSNTEMIKLLVGLRMSVDAIDTEGVTPLHVASEVGNHDNAKALLNLGAAVEYTSKKGWNALHYATSAKLLYAELILLLIEFGIDINTPDSKGKAPLHLAAERGHDDVVEILLNAGVNVNVVTAHGQNALHCTEIPEVAMLLIESGIDVGLQDCNGVSVVHLACQRRQYDLVRVLLTEIENVNVVTKQGRNCLHYASGVCGPNVEIIKLLMMQSVEMGSDIYGLTPLHLASGYNNYCNVKALLAAGADVNARTKGGRTALHYAADSKIVNRQVINLLIDSGVDLIAEDLERLTVLELALKHKNNVLVQILLERAVYSGNSEAVERFLKSEMDIKLITLNKIDYPLYFAAKNGCLQPDLLMKMTKIIKEHIESQQSFSMLSLIEYLKEQFVN